MLFRTLYPASKKLLLDYVSELDIFLLFCDDFKSINTNFSSPIIIDGIESGNRSANITYINGRFFFRDFRLGKSFSCFDLTMFITGLSFKDSIQYLCEKFNLPVIGNFNLVPTRKILSKEDVNIMCEEKRHVEIDVQYKPWDEKSIKYWMKHGWLPHMLDKANIRPIKRFWMSIEDEYRNVYEGPSLGPLSFCYDFGEIDGAIRRKIYNPQAHNNELKWKNNANKNVIQALNTIDHHPSTLYIVSSMKDCGPYWTLLGHPCAVAPNSESTGLTVEQVRMLRQISDKQVIWYDSDKVGRMNAEKQGRLYGFDWTWNPISAPKDQSDYVYKRGLNEFKKLLDAKNCSLRIPA